MDILSLNRIVSSEKESLKYVFEYLRNSNNKKDNKIINTNIKCLNHFKDYYILSQKRVKCAYCKHTIYPLKQTLLSKLRIPLNKTLMLIKMFELLISARKTSQELKIAYKTTLKGYELFRKAILKEIESNQPLFKGEIEADEAYFGGKRKGNRGRGSLNKQIVFGILERDGKVSVDIVPDVTSSSLLKSTVKKVKRGSIIYTDKWKGYDSLMFCGYRHLKVDHSKVFARGKVYINGIEGFWSFAKERLIHYHGINPEKFILYIKEMEFRYNNRDKDLFDLILNLMLKFNW